MPDGDSEHSIETWAIHNRINLYLLAAIPDEGMSASMSPLNPPASGGKITTRGRSVLDLFAHIHNVRLMWLKAAAPSLLVGIHKIDPKVSIPKADISVALTASPTRSRDRPERRSLNYCGRVSPPGARSKGSSHMPSPS